MLDAAMASTNNSAVLVGTRTILEVYPSSSSRHALRTNFGRSSSSCCCMISSKNSQAHHKLKSRFMAATGQKKMKQKNFLLRMRGGGGGGGGGGLLRVLAQLHEAEEEKEEPILLRISVSLVTEILQLVSFGGIEFPAMSSERGSHKLEQQWYRLFKWGAKLFVGSPQSAIVEAEEETTSAEPCNVIESLRQDYQRAYFLTGDFTASLYADDCLFADPTIQFRGRKKYQRNLKLLVPFFDEPSLTLSSIEEEVMKGNERTINAQWNLRTYLRLPWKPLIEVDGSTLYIINADSKIVKHIESWSITGRQAIQQLFVPSDRAFGRAKTL